MHFVIIYTVEAHPMGSTSPYFDREAPGAYSTDQEGEPVGQPSTYEARLELARKTVAEQGINVPVLVDEMDNPLWCTYGPAPDIAYLIGTEGKVIAKQGWYEPAKMETAMLAYLNNE